VAKRSKGNLYLGVDVGGTKIIAALVKSCGTILVRERRDTPRGGPTKDTVDAILAAMVGALAAGAVKPGQLAAIGLAIAGVVEPDKGRVVVTPNMNLSGLRAEAAIRKVYDVPVAVGNDVNLGTLGEKWLGAARKARSAVGIFVGTGIGGGVIIENKLLRGAREAAGEIGHIVMQPGGPLCGCGNRGCLEALASRSAIERDLREAMAAGRKSVLADLIKKSQGVIKSKALKRALKANDPLVTQVMRRASEILGYACLTVRHLVDPDVIVLGGGVIEACGGFVLPIVRKIVAADALPGARKGGEIVESELGDDAVPLGAVVIAQELIGECPLSHG
jgi:glucokinase